MNGEAKNQMGIFVCFCRIVGAGRRRFWWNQMRMVECSGAMCS